MFLTFEQSFYVFLSLKKTLHKVIFNKFFKVGSGSAKNECGSTALVLTVLIFNSLGYWYFHLDPIIEISTLFRNILISLPPFPCEKFLIIKLEIYKMKNLTSSENWDCWISSLFWRSNWPCLFDCWGFHLVLTEVHQLFLTVEVFTFHLVLYWLLNLSMVLTVFTFFWPPKILTPFRCWEITLLYCQKF